MKSIDVMPAVLMPLLEHLFDVTVAPYAPDPDGPQTVTTRFARALFEEAKLRLEEDGGCDHSVGICACDVTRALEELRLALDGRRICPTCGGDGTWDVGEIVTDQGDVYHDIRACPTCDTRGYVPAGARVLK